MSERETTTYSLTNVSPAPRGLGLADGSTINLMPGAAAIAALTVDEAAEVEALGWFKIEAAPEADDANLDTMTVDELKAFAAANDIDLGGATKKADILSAIESALTTPAV